jgi:pilus assembly protein CpaB
LRFKPLIMIALAIVFGASAILVGNSWVQRQAAANRPVAAATAPETPRATLVVAAAPLRYGEEVAAGRLKEIAWLGDALPAGAFAKIDDVLRDGRRLVLAPIEANEPVLRGKITGEGQRATLSALIADDLSAVTVQVDEVVGIGGFVLPGDRVDVLLTQKPSDGSGKAAEAFSERILQNVRVLAVGQAADQTLDKPTVVRSATLEVTVTGAQKLTLATKLGTLSLALRKAGETATRASRRLDAAAIAEDDDVDGDAVSVQVTRGSQRMTYSVLRMKSEPLPDMPYATGNVKRGAPALERSDATAAPPRGDR